MGLHAGEHITFSTVPEMQRYSATILSIDDKSIVLRPNAGFPADLPLGQYITIAEAEGDIDYYTEVAGRDGEALRLRRVWTGKRGFFRVDDVFPVLCRKVNTRAPMPESRIFSGYTAELSDISELDTQDESVSPRLWKMLVDINTKLGLILERLHLESEGLTKAESIPVNISASGMRFLLNDKHEMDDVIEVKMLLPTYPPVGILTHGKVVRVEERDNGRYETSLRFVDMADDVRDVIIQYTLKRQREIVRRYRDQGREA